MSITEALSQLEECKFQFQEILDDLGKLQEFIAEQSNRCMEQRKRLNELQQIARSQSLPPYQSTTLAVMPDPFCSPCPGHLPSNAQSKKQREPTRKSHPHKVPKKLKDMEDDLKLMECAIVQEPTEPSFSGLPSSWHYFDTPGKGPKNPQVGFWYWTILLQEDAECSPQQNGQRWRSRPRWTTDNPGYPKKGELVRYSDYTPESNSAPKGLCFKFFCEEGKYVFLFYFEEYAPRLRNHTSFASSDL